MMPKSEAAAVVMIGSFNPAIFQPRWLGSQKLIRPEEANNATIRAIQAEVADFSTEWFQFQAVQDRVQMVSSDPRHYPALRDLAGSIFAVLQHTPVQAVGINRQFHYQMPSVEGWHSLGHLLAPKSYWEDLVDKPGMKSLVIVGRRKSDSAGTLNVQVQPSANIEHGVFVQVNVEFQRTDDEMTGAEWVPECLAEHWDNVMDYSETMLEHIVGIHES